MSKNVEKKAESKELEKKLETKEIKPEKFEHKEFKEKPEKREIKEFKEKPERKEFKEPIKEKVEVKEIKELEKQVIEKGGKELVETVEPGGEVVQPLAAVKPKEIEKIKPEKEHAEKAVQKEIEKIKPEKEFEKIKPEKETPEKAVQKEIEKIKPEKENAEKVVQSELSATAAKAKEIEKIKPEKELKLEKHELKDHKIEKIEHKEFKLEKHELKDLKVEIFEKTIQKDLLPEKQVLENDPKGIVENPGQPGFEGDPALKFTTTGTPDERMRQLEDAVNKLSHFIGVDLRPDLSKGALKNEADVNTGKGTDAGADDKSKKKQ